MEVRGTDPHTVKIPHTRRDPKKNPELSSGGWAPCSTGFPRQVVVLGTHLYQCTSWHCCEKLHSASVNFFENSFNICPLHDGWFTSTPAHTALSVQQFLTKISMNPMPHPLCSPLCSFRISPWMTFFYFLRWKMSSKGKRFANVEEVKPKKTKTKQNKTA